MAELEDRLGDRQARVMVWEAEPVSEAVAALRERGLESVVVEPLAAGAGDRDFVAAMRENIAVLASLGD